MKLDHIALNVENIERSVSWYLENLDSEVLYQDDTWAMVKVGDSKIALTVKNQHPPHLGFEVDDIRKLPCESPKYHRDGSAYHYITDVDGNTIEFVYYPPDSL